MSFFGTLVSSPYNVPSADGVYGYKAPPLPSQLPTVPTSNAVIYGAATWGVKNVPLTVAATPAALYDAIGAAYPQVNGQASPFSILPEALNATDPGFKLSQITLVPIRDGTETAAVITILDANGGVWGTLTAVSPGTRGNSGSATFAAGTFGTTASPTYNLTLAIANGTSQTYSGVSGYAALGGGYNAAAAKTAMSAAVNQGIGVVAAPSRYWVFSAGPSALPPAYATYSASGGSDGASGITTQTLLGNPAQGNNSGLYAAATQVVGGSFCVAGLTDPAAAATMAAFATATLSIPVATFPLGTQTGSPSQASTSIFLKTNNGMLQPSLVTVQDFLQIEDQITGAVRYISPLGFTLGAIASQPPENSPGNKPLATLILASERSSNPVEVPEASMRALAGITYWAQVNGQWVLANGQNASGASDFTGGINFVRMSNFLLLANFAILQPYVDALQGDDPLEDQTGTRAKAKAALRTFYGVLKRARRIAGYEVFLDATNNTPATTAAGFLYPYSRIDFMKTVRFIVPTIDPNGGLALSIETQAPG